MSPTNQVRGTPPWGIGTTHPEVWRAKRLKQLGFANVEFSVVAGVTLMRCCGHSFVTKVLDEAEGPDGDSMKGLLAAHKRRHKTHG